MSFVIQDPETEALAQRLAVVQGITVEQAVMRSLQATAIPIGLAAERALDDALTELRLWAKDHIRRDSDGRGRRVVDEMLGYNERGEW